MLHTSCGAQCFGAHSSSWRWQSFSSWDRGSSSALVTRSSQPPKLLFPGCAGSYMTLTESLYSNSSAKMFINDKNYSNTYQRIHLSAVSANWLDYHVKAQKLEQWTEISILSVLYPRQLKYSIPHKISWFIKMILIFISYIDKHNEVWKITLEDPCPLSSFHFLHCFFV